MANSQPTFRLTQNAEGDGKYRVEIALEGIRGVPRQTATARFSFALSPQDQEDLRWYLEDYLQYPLDPAPKIAARVEQRIAEIGTGLFKSIFQADDDTRDLWAKFRESLDDARVEIITGVREAAVIPWELLRDPKTDTPLALRARAFVRTISNPAQTPRLPETKSGQIRILLVICRPGGSDDVPFRSVARTIVQGLSENARAAFQLDVLRPPTFARLNAALRAAKNAGAPYHVVHFDGHGLYVEVAAKNELGELRKRIGALVFAGLREGSHGYLAFENSSVEENMELVDGPALGKLLVETDVGALVLNACRSAFADAPSEPATATSDDVHAQTRAFGTLAQEVIDAGVAGVVATRYNLYVVTAAQFVADLYAALVQGSPLGEAVTMGRKQLVAQPLREIAYKPIALQDWTVPVVYEAAPMALFSRAEGQPQGLPIRIALDAGAQSRTKELGLPPRPEVGFFGRDETLLALDRAFDSQSIVLLHAFAGSGKTTTAAEFARWYALTGGVEGAILFTSFEQHKPLPRVLDTIGQVFGDALERSGVNWLALDDAARRDIALQLLKQVPVLWIWDNVEPIAGFPAGTKSAWNEKEQRELREFLNDARETQAKFLLTSRRDEEQWLGLLPRRITIPPMPMQERVQLARAIAEKFGRRITDVDDWRPLLQFTQGNPLAITVLVGQALKERLRERKEIDDFVGRLRAGEAAFDYEASEGRSKSLGASLSYGFASAFTEAERKQLALLHFFQGFVDVRVLQTMGHPERGWCLPEVHGLQREAVIALLDRAAEIGLLTAHGGGSYSIHPALPWYFKSLYEQYYPTEDEGRKTENDLPSLVVRHPSALRAYVEAMGELSNYYWSEYESGNRDVIGALTAEEANLLHARQLARSNGWGERVISTMQGLRQLYAHTGRRAEWARLVNEIVPDFVDPATDGPLAGREEEWGLVTDYRVRLARQARQWAQAERLQHVRLDWERRRAAPALWGVQSNVLDDAQRNAIRTLAVSLGELGNIQREQNKSECVAAYEEAIPLCQRIGDKPEEAIIAFNLGHAYKNIPTIRDLAQAERWYQRGLELLDERDNLGRSKGLLTLGNVAYERFKEAHAAKQPEQELLRHLNAAVQFDLQSLDLLPPNAVNDLAVTHNALGTSFDLASELDRALLHYREAIRYFEAAGDLYNAATTRYNVALALERAGRLADAREYALAALRNFETYGERAAEMVEMTKGLIAEIEAKLKGKS